MEKIKAVGITSMGCKACAGLKKVLEERFAARGVELEFVSVVYEQDPETATEVCDEYGLDDIPSFWINGVVFHTVFKDEDVENAIRCQ